MSINIHVNYGPCSPIITKQIESEKGGKYNTNFDFTEFCRKVVKIYLSNFHANLPIDSLQSSLRHTNGTGVNFGRTVIMDTTSFPHAVVGGSVCPFDVKDQILNKGHLMNAPNDL